MPVPFVPGQDVMQVEVIGSINTIPCENVLYFKHISAITPAVAQALVDSVRAYWVTNFLPLLATQVALKHTYGTDLTTQTSPTYTSALVGPTTGAQAGDMLPRNDSLSISFRSANRGKSSRGRNYWWGFVESQVTNSLVSAGHVSNIVAEYAGMIGAGAVSAGWTWGVFSRKTLGAWRTAGLFQPITSVIVVDDLVDSQRGRLK